MKQETVTINGVIYNAATGLPVEAIKKPTRALKTVKSGSKLATKVVGTKVTLRKTPSVKSTAVKATSATKSRGSAHAKKPQKSVTLNRRYVSKPVNKVHVSAPRLTTVAKHPEVSHFNNDKPLPSPVKLPAKPITRPTPKPITTPKNLVLDIRKPVVSKVVAPKPSPKKALPLEEVDHVFSEVTKSIEQEVKKDIKRVRKSPKSFYVITGIIVVMLIAGILAVFSLPQIEMMIASRYAGVNGSIPSYQVPGYRVNGSINYADGQVKVSYWNDRQNEKYTVIESKTTDADQEIVISGNTAVFIKKGVRYQITYSALSEEQVRRITDSF